MTELGKDRGLKGLMKKPIDDVIMTEMYRLGTREDESMDECWFVIKQKCSYYDSRRHEKECRPCQYYVPMVYFRSRK